MRRLKILIRPPRRQALIEYTGNDQRKYLKRNIIIGLILSLVVCKSLTAQSTQSEIRPSIQRIVFKLKKEQTLHLGFAIDLAGIPEKRNKYYKLYQKLSAKASDEELVMLTKENSRTIFLYSFLALYSRNYNDLKRIFLENCSDTSRIWIAGGCTGVASKLNSFMLRQLNPAYVDSRLPYFTQEEYDSYVKLIDKTDADD